MDSSEQELDGVLSAILLGMLIPDNSTEASRLTLQTLSKVVSNAKTSPEESKFKRLPHGNDKIKERIINVPGASEFLDAIGFIREGGGSGDFVLQDISRLSSAEKAINEAIASLPPATAATTAAATTTTSGTRKPTPSSNQGGETSEDYEKRKKESEARQAEIQRKMEEDRKKKEALRAQMKAEQREVRDRPIVASHAVSIQRASTADTGAGGDGKIRYTNSHREFESVLSSKTYVLANFTASWCGPCQAIAPAIEQMARSNPHVTFIKIDIDENNETPSKYNVQAVPTFILFKQGQNIGEVKGANQAGVQSLVAKATS